MRQCETYYNITLIYNINLHHVRLTTNVMIEYRCMIVIADSCKMIHINDPLHCDP